MRLDHVQLAIPPHNETRCATFLLAAGFAKISKPEVLKSRDRAWYRRGKTALHLGIEDVFAPELKAHPARATYDLDALAAIGAPVCWGNDIAGRRRFFHGRSRRHPHRIHGELT